MTDDEFGAAVNRDELPPVTIQEIGAAMFALGMYDRELTPAEHAENEELTGSAHVYRVRMVNALMGTVQREAMLADLVELDEEDRHAAWAQQMRGAAAWEDPAMRMAFMGWQVYRAVLPLRMLVEGPDTGAIPAAAEHTAEALHVMLGVLGAIHEATVAGDDEGVVRQMAVLKAARGLLQDAIDKTDTVLAMVESAGE